MWFCCYGTSAKEYFTDVLIVVVVVLAGFPEVLMP